MALRRLRAATSASSRSFTPVASRYARAWSAARLCASGQSGVTVYGSSCSASTSAMSPGDDFPNE